MDPNRRRSLRLRKFLLACIFAAIAIAIVFAALQKSDWNVPEEAKQRKNPLPPSAAALQAAATTYRDKCAQCHGPTGKGDGPEGKRHDPPPASFTDAPRMNAVSDGELFFKISKGRRPMPSFRSRLTEEQRWQLVLLIRSFARKSSAPETPPASEAQPALGKQPAPESRPVATSPR
ncbi:MAG: c-type cytochrome [Acidobacteriia bacterium]|nr:c-type cytochrome [Terriglobia bacterium]